MYLIYDEETKSYKFHSQVVPESEPVKEKKVKKKKKRKGSDEEDKVQISTFICICKLST